MTDINLPRQRPGARLPERFGWTRVGRLGAALLLCASAWVPASAEEKEPPPRSTWSLTVENDWFVQTDVHYTNGIQFGVRRWHPEAPGLGLPCPASLCPNGRLVYAETQVGQLMYTPRDITIAAPQPLDRPWAGWLYATSSRLYESPNGDQDTLLTLQVGILGPAAQAGPVQKRIHEWTKSDPPMGWHNQIGGQLGVNVGIQRSYELLTVPVGRDFELGASWRWRAIAGNVMTLAGLGYELQVGNRAAPVDAEMPDLNPPFPAPRPEPPIGPKVWKGFGRISPAQRASTVACISSRLACSFSARADVWVVGYNAFLQGRLLHDDPSVRKRALVGELSAAVRFDVLRARGRPAEGTDFFVQVRLSVRSPEFRSPLAKSHRFAAVTIGRDF